MEQDVIADILEDQRRLGQILQLEVIQNDDTIVVLQRRAALWIIFIAFVDLSTGLS